MLPLLINRRLVISLSIIMLGVLYDIYTTRQYRRWTEEMHRDTDKAIADALAPIRDLDHKQW